MKLLRLIGIIALGAVATSTAAESLEEALQRTALDYAQRLEAATKELNAVRERIATEEGPLVRAITEQQNQIVVLESEITRLESGQAQLAGTLSRTQREFESTKRNLNYVTSQGLEAFKSFSDAMGPGEKQVMGVAFKNLQDRFDDPNHPPDSAVALDTLDRFADYLTRALGGYSAPGSSLVGDDNRVRKGTFVFMGPETFFQTDEGDARGIVRAREGSGLYPLTYPLTAWKSEKAAPLFQGQMASIPADASGGKALRLQETKGTFLEHVHKGGIVAYLIIGVGLLALVIIAMKLVDDQRLQVDEPPRVRAVLTLLADGKVEEATRAAHLLRATSREVLAKGLQHLGKSKDALEEHLFALLQAQRLHFERRLPLLTVIATASPLMGLLGTVMGMVKTFSLITVFGTGNAAKLSSGISEVLVTTELGLAVAIPTLVAHGFLAHRIHKKLALLERYAAEFVAAAEEARTETPTVRTG